MKNILIIGASGGTGSAILKRAPSSYKLFAISRNRPAPIFSNANFIPFEEDNFQKSISELPDVLHGFVYCPGTVTLKSFSRITDDDMLNDFQVNALKAVKCLQPVLPRLKKAENSSVVFFSSVVVQTGMPNHVSIAMAKGAVEGLTRNLAAELAPENIRVNAIAPSLTESSLTERLLHTPQRREAAAQRHPLKRFGQPEDLADAVLWLLSDSSGWITGQVIGVDGGIGKLRN
jgi:3-oxoacyl-[acyl-carrier protein] reductase